MSKSRSNIGRNFSRSAGRMHPVANVSRLFLFFHEFHILIREYTLSMAF
jgi:hypothetical protein